MRVSERGVYIVVPGSLEHDEEQYNECGEHVATVEVRRISNPSDFLPYRVRLEFRDITAAEVFSDSQMPIEITVDYRDRWEAPRRVEERDDGVSRRG